MNLAQSEGRLLNTAGLFRAAQYMALATLSLLGEQAYALPTWAVGIAAAVCAAAGILCNVIVARRLSPYQAMTAVVWSSLMLCGACGLLADFSSLIAFATGVILVGCAGGLMFPAMTSRFGMTVRKDRDRLFAEYGVALALGLAIAPLLEACLLAVGGQNARVPYWACGVLAFMGAWSAWGDSVGSVRVSRLIVGSTSSARVRVGSRRPAAMAVRVGCLWLASLGELARAVRTRWGSGPQLMAGHVGRHSLAARGLIRNERWRVALLVEMAITIPFSGVVAFGFLAAERGFGLRSSQAALPMALFFAASVGMRVALMARAVLSRKRLLVWICMGGMLVGVAVVGFAPGLGWFTGGLVVLGISHGISYPVVTEQVAEALDSGQLVSGNSYMSAASGLVMVLVPVALGALGQLVGLRDAFGLLCVPIVLGGVVLWRDRQVAW